MRNKINKIIFYFIAIFVAVLVLIPFLWMLSTSFKSRSDIISIPIKWIPDPFSLYGYKKIFNLFNFKMAIINSMIVSTLITLITVISSSMAAFIFAKIDFKGRNILFVMFIATMMIPGQVTTIPLFLVMKNLGLVGKYFGVISLSIFNAFSIFLIRQQIMTISNTYIEAALIDGAGYFRIFYKIILPFIKGTIATLVIITFMGAWNDYYWPLIILNNQKKMTLPVLLSLMNTQYGTEFNTLCAGALISMIPILILYIFGQKYFIEGIQLGGLKG